MKLIENIKIKYSKELKNYYNLRNVKKYTDGKMDVLAFDPNFLINNLITNLKNEFPYNINFSIREEKMILEFIDLNISLDIDNTINLYYHIWLGDNDFFVRVNSETNVILYGDDEVTFKTEDQINEFNNNYNDYLEKLNIIKD